MTKGPGNVLRRTTPPFFNKWPVALRSGVPVSRLRATTWTERQGEASVGEKGVRQQQPAAPKVTWAQAFRDVTIVSINKGQLPVLGCIGIALFMLYRMPQDSVGLLAQHVVDRLSAWELAGWVLCLLVMACWYYHARWMRRSHADELHRIGSEKSKLQGKAAGTKFPSSRRR